MKAPVRIETGAFLCLIFTLESLFAPTNTFFEAKMTDFQKKEDARFAEKSKSRIFASRK